MNIKSPIANWEDIVRGFDRAKEPERVPYAPEVKTTSATYWDLNKAYNRETTLRYQAQKANQMALTPKQRQRRPPRQRSRLRSPQPQNFPSSINSIRMPKGKD